MLTFPPSVKVYFASEPMDMRRGFDGLAAVVRSQWKLNVFSGHVFAFVGRRRDLVKLLVWYHGGFVLISKRLERGRFQMPAVSEDAVTVTLDATQLAMLLDGINVNTISRPTHWEPPKNAGDSDLNL